MRLELTGRHVEITPGLRRLVDRRLAPLQRMLNDGMISAQIVLTRERFRHKADVTLHARGEKFLHAVGASDSWAASLAEATEKLSQQAHKVKGKWQSRKRRAVSSRADATAAAEAAPAPEPNRRRRIVRARPSPGKPLTLEEAALELDNAKEHVLIFRNATTDTINVLYRRTNGDLGLVEPED
jgi:putative sigma-54 modulation protein